MYKELKPLQDQYAKQEKELEALLTEQADVEAQLADPAVYADGAQATALLKRFNELRDATEKCMESMGQLEERMAELEAKRAPLGDEL